MYKNKDTSFTTVKVTKSSVQWVLLKIVSGYLLDGQNHLTDDGQVCTYCYERFPVQGWDA
jgi:hypothetical protein